MKTNQERKVYKSPQRKLVRFFEKSRDQWKAKCRIAKAQVKRLKNRVRWLEHSRDQWKQHAQALQVELEQIQAKTTSQPQAETSSSSQSTIEFVESPRSKRKPRKTVS